MWVSFVFRFKLSIYLKLWAIYINEERIEWSLFIPLFFSSMYSWNPLRLLPISCFKIASFTKNLTWNRTSSFDFLILFFKICLNVFSNSYVSSIFFKICKACSPCSFIFWVDISPSMFFIFANPSISSHSFKVINLYSKTLCVVTTFHI